MSKKENDFEPDEEARKKRLNKTLAIVAVVMFGVSFLWHIVPIFFKGSP
ncbi:MAG: hypothetical protein IIA62_09180 [Nitrospinae bacterium]|nr:hypothetical protein [Nitrospinota bacterium]